MHKPRGYYGIIVNLDQISTGMFVTEKQENGFDKIVLEDTGHCSVEIVPDCGAMLHAMKVYKENACCNLIDSYPDRSTFTSGAEAAGFMGLKLSPFPCRIKNAGYRFEGTDYRLQSFIRDSDAMHGLLYNKPFSVTDRIADEEKASVTLVYDYTGSDSGYPFPYRCRVDYTLEKGNRLTIRTTITNTGDKTLPVADGWHPYFTLGEKVNDLHLQFHSDKMLEFENLVPTGKVLPDDRFRQGARIDAAEIDNSFILDVEAPQPMCTLRNSEWRLEFYPDKSYPYLQIYIPPHRNSIAIENLSAPPDAFNNNISLTVLPPGGEAVFTTAFAAKKS